MLQKDLNVWFKIPQMNLAWELNVLVLLAFLCSCEGYYYYYYYYYRTEEAS